MHIPPILPYRVVMNAERPALSASRKLRESALASRALCRVVVAVSYPMDFVAVPAGTLPAAALALRGADPSVTVGVLCDG